MTRRARPPSGSPGLVAALVSDDDGDAARVRDVLREAAARGDTLAQAVLADRDVDREVAAIVALLGER